MNKIGYRPTWAEINLGNLEYNFKQVKNIVPEATRVMVTVKADAYGHGLLPISKRLVRCGVDYLGVASIDEAVQLRSAGIKIPVLVLGMPLCSDIGPVLKYRLCQTVCSREIVESLQAQAQRHKIKACVHIKVDTGMGRMGMLYEDAFDFIRWASAMPNIVIEGIFTHLACADTDKILTRRQLSLMCKLTKKLHENGVAIPLIHAANSLGVLNYPEFRKDFTMVRPGLVIYGLYPSQNCTIRLKPVLSLKTRVVFIKRVPAGYGISYGHTYRTHSATTVAVLPIGYGDGYPRNLSNQSDVLIRGRRFKISGRVCMDQIMVDVGEVPVRVGDEAVLIGRQKKETISAEELAALSGTIPYEISCGLGSRVPRVYIS